MSSRSEVSVGTTFGRLTVLRETVSSSRGRRFLCGCECAGEREVRLDHLRSGATRSCGCLCSDVTRERSQIHGESARGKRSAEYGVWVRMKQRCLNPNDKLYPYYGGRGARDGNYEPGNVRWATRTEQNRNKRSNRVVEFQGEERCLSEWAEVIGFPYKLIHDRLNKLGWAVERAFTTPRRGN